MSRTLTNLPNFDEVTSLVDIPSLVRNGAFKLKLYGTIAVKFKIVSL